MTFAGKDSFTRAGLISFSVIALSAVITFISHVVLARFLTPSDFGLFILSLSWLHILVMLGCLGFNTANLKFIPQLTTKQKQYRRFAAQNSFCASMFIAAVFLLVLTLLKPSLNYTLYLGLSLTAVLIPLRVYNQLSLSALRAKRLIFLAQFPEGLLRPVLFLICIMGVYSFSSLNAIRAIGLNIALHFFIVFIYFLLIKKHFKENPFSITGDELENESAWLKTALIMMGMSVSLLIFQKADLIIFRLFMPAHDTGIYAAIATLSSLFYMGSNTIAIALNPMIAALDQKKDRIKLQSLFNQARLLQSIGFGSGFLIILFFGQYILSLYGADYIEGKTALIILTGLFFASCLFGPAMMYAMIRGQHRLSALIVSISAILTITLLILLIPTYGMIGAAIATGCGWFLMQAAFYISVKRIQIIS